MTECHRFSANIQGAGETDNEGWRAEGYGGSSSECHPPRLSALPEAHLALHPPGTGARLGVSLPKGCRLVSPDMTLTSALLPTHPSPLSDPETDPESNQSRRLQLPTRMAG